MTLTLAIFKTSNDHQIWLSLAIFGSLARSSTKQTLAIFGYWNFHLHAGLFCKKKHLSHCMNWQTVIKHGTMALENNGKYTIKMQLFMGQPWDNSCINVETCMLS